MGKIARRDFLRAAPATAGIAALVASNAGTRAETQEKTSSKPADVKISGTCVHTDRGLSDPTETLFGSDAHRHLLEAQGRDQRGGDDSVRGGEADRNATRFQRQRAGSGDSVACRRTRTRSCRPRSTRGCSSSKARPAAATTASRSRRRYYNATGKRDLLDQAITSADALYNDFAANDPPFSGGERDAINCVQLYRVTHDKKHLDLAKHYLDIRGLAELGEPQPAQPVLQAGARAERSGRPRRELRVADGVARRCRRAHRDQGLPRRRAADVARRRRAQDVHHRRRRHDGQRRVRRAVLAAEHLRLLRNLRGADVHHAEPPAVHGDRRQQVHRRDGARHVQQRPRAACPRRAIASSTSTGWRAPATDAICAGSARRSSAARRTSCASWRRCPASSTRRIRRARSTSTCTSRATTSFTVGAKDIGAVGRERDAVGRQHRRSPCRPTDDVEGRDQAAHSRLGAQSAGSGHALHVRRHDARSRRRSSVNGRASAPLPDQTGLRYARSRVEERRRDRASISRSRSRRVVADSRVAEDRGRDRRRARADRLLRGMARRRRRPRARRAGRSVGAADSRRSTRSFYGGVHGHRDRRAKRSRNPSSPADADHAHPVLPLGQSRRRGNERLAVDERVTRSATSVLRAASSSMRTRTTPPMAGGISRRRRSIRAPAPSGAASARAIPGRARDRDRHGQAEHRRHARRVHRTGDRGAICAPASASTALRGWFLPSRDELALMYRNLKAAGARRFPRRRRRRQLHATGRRRSRRRTWRRTSISPISAASMATTRTFRGGCGPFGRSDASSSAALVCASLRM